MSVLPEAVRVAATGRNAGDGVAFEGRGRRSAAADGGVHGPGVPGKAG